MKEPLAPEFFLRQESFKNWATGTNETDCRYWDQWLAQNPEHLSAATLVAMQYIGLQEPRQDVSDAEIMLEWNKLKTRLESNAKVVPLAKQVWFGQWWKIASAACLAALATAGAFVFMNTPYSIEYTTGANERKTIHLSDGTEIAINANSKVLATAKWRFAPARDITMKGEAYFKVTHHPNEPAYRDFVVHTNDLDVTVLGTEFNVDARRSRTFVVLDKGKVQLNLKQNSEGQSLVLAPGESATWSQSEGEVIHGKPEAANKHIGEWRLGYYNFSHTTLAEVIGLVEAENDVSIILDDSKLAQETITGRVPNNNLNQIMLSLAKLFNLDYRAEGKNLYLTRKKTRSGELAK